MNTSKSLLLAPLALGLASLAHAQTTFTTNTPNTCQRPDSIRAGDLDLDGLVDVLSTHPGSNEVCVNRNLGGGTSWSNGTLFTYPSSPPSEPTESVIAQFDGAGRPDVAVVLRATAQVAIHTASGAWPGFAPPQIVNINQGPFEATAFDYDLDGDLDLAIACDLPQVVHILGNTGGVFTTVGVIPIAPEFPTSIEAGDLNADGRADLALTTAGGRVLVLINTTAGVVPTFAAPQLFPIDPRPYGITIGDLNGDGFNDIATANAGFSTMNVLLNNPLLLPGTTVGFATTLYPLAPGVIAGPWTEVEHGDLDCDGDNDLAVTCNSSNRVVCFWNNGSGTFTGPNAFASPLDPQDLAFADFNNDGQLDMTTNNPGSAQHGILLNNLSTGCCEHILIGGVSDGFNTTSPSGPEDACPSPALTTWYTGPRRDFDGPVACGRPFMHTFPGIPGMVKSARLRMRMRADCTSSPTDRLMLGFDTGTGLFAWSQNVSTLTGSPWTPGSFGGVSLDLGALPGGTSLLSKISTDGRLDVVFRDGTAVDSIILIVETCAPADNPMGHNATPYITGTTWTWSASGAPLPAGGTAFFLGAGLGMGPTLPGGMLCITSPSILGIVPTTASGTASFSIPVPVTPAPPCLTLTTQAFSWNAGFTTFSHSNTLVQQIFD